MKVDRATAVTKKIAGETVYLCSPHCLHVFEADPEKYVRADAQAPAGHGHAARAHH